LYPQVGGCHLEGSECFPHFAIDPLNNLFSI